MKYLKQHIVAITLLIFSLGWATKTPVYAEESSGNQEDVAGAAGFTYSVNFPENQVKEDIGYFHLKMQPSAKQVLVIDVSNPGKEKIIIDVGLNGAKTNQNGVIEYGVSDLKNDSSLKYDFKDIVTGPDRVELAGGESKKIEITIKMPERNYDGVIAGGIQLMKEDQGEEETSNKGSKIINQYAYVIGVLFQESDKTLTPDLQMNKITVNQSNYRNAVFVNFSNVIAAYLNDMTVEVQVTKKGSETVLYERKQTGMRMAPNSFIDFPVSMNGERMVPGDYNADILVTSGDKKWAWNQAFKITDEDASKFNERDVGLVQEKSVDWKLILLFVAGFLVCILFLFFIIHFVQKRKKEKAMAAKKSRKKKKKQVTENSSNE